MKSCMLFINLVQVGAAVGALCVKSKLVQCASLKSNMGHLEASAAAGGLVSLALVPFGTCAIAGNAQLHRSVGVLLTCIGTSYQQKVEHASHLNHVIIVFRDACRAGATGNS